MNIAQLEAEIFSLPVQDRASLAQRILLSLEEISDIEFEQLWAEESAQRIVRFDLGKSKTIPGDEGAKKARALLK